MDLRAVDKKQYLKDVQPIINSAIKSYGGGDPSLRTRAQVMAIDALRTFNPNKGVDIKTHVHNTLHGLSRHARKRREPIHIPERWTQEFDRVKAEELSFTSEKGREPTLTELADTLGIPEKRIALIKARTPQTMTEGMVTTDKGDLIHTKDEDPLQQWADYVYHDLDDIDKKIFEWGTGYGGSKKLPKIEIAQKLKMSPPAVSQRISKIVKRLSEGLS